MLRIISQDGSFVHVVAAGQLDAQECLRLYRQLALRARQRPLQRLLVDATLLDGWWPPGLSNQGATAGDLSENLEKIALVGCDRRQELIVGILTAFLSVQVRCFPQSFRTEALHWLHVLDQVDEAGDESFPASDPPSYTAGH